MRGSHFHYLLDRMHDKWVVGRRGHYLNRQVRFSLQDDDAVAAVVRANISVDLPTPPMTVDSRASTLMFSEAYNLDRNVRKPFVNSPKHSSHMAMVDDLLSEQLAHHIPALLSDLPSRCQSHMTILNVRHRLGSYSADRAHVNNDFQSDYLTYLNFLILVCYRLTCPCYYQGTMKTKTMMKCSVLLPCLFSHFLTNLEALTSPPPSIQLPRSFSLPLLLMH